MRKWGKVGEDVRRGQIGLKSPQGSEKEAIEGQAEEVACDEKGKTGNRRVGAERG